MKDPQVNQWPKKKSVASNGREVCAPSNAGTADADRRFQSSQTRSIASVALLALLMAAALGWWLLRRLTRPMTQLAHATHRLAAGHHDVRVHLDGEPVDLTPAEVRLLHTLHAAPGRVFSRQQLLNHLHDDGRAVTDRVVDSHVRNLRRKLATVTQGIDPIRSVYGVGYSFEWPASD